tara:strand:+ start:4509 stop:5054 length:546 start_codon:yes stop_codon:yes gene_type:complete
VKIGYLKQLCLVIIIFTLSLTNIQAARAEGLIGIGSYAPKFELIGFDNKSNSFKKFKLDDFLDSWIVLYFYPKDFTEGCTLEAKGFTSNLKKFRSLNVQVIGISADVIDDHKSFCTEEELGYPLLSDQNGLVSRLYGSWIDPFSSRNTFLIDPTGKIRFRWIGVRPIHHAEEVLDKLSTML